MEKIATILLVAASLMGCSTGLVSQAIPDPQLSQYECRIFYDGTRPFTAFRGLKGSPEAQWQPFSIPANWVVRLPLNDCGRSPRVVCPYELYIYTGNKMTCKIDLEGTKSYRIYWDPILQWQVAEEKR